MSPTNNNRKVKKIKGQQINKKKKKERIRKKLKKKEFKNSNILTLEITLSIITGSSNLPSVRHQVQVQIL